MICYGIKAPDDSRIRYVGQTKLRKEERLEQHFSNSRKVRSQTPLSKWLRKHPDAIAIELGAVNSGVDEDAELIDMLEIHLISQYRSLGQADLNVRDGGKTSGDEFRIARANSESAKLKRKLTDSLPETKNRRSEAQKKVRLNSAWKQRQSNAQKIAHGSTEARVKTSELTKAGMTEDVKRHLREVFSKPEVKAKRSAAQQARRARERAAKSCA